MKRTPPILDKLKYRFTNGSVQKNSPQLPRIPSEVVTKSHVIPFLRVNFLFFRCFFWRLFNAYIISYIYIYIIIQLYMCMYIYMYTVYSIQYLIEKESKRECIIMPYSIKCWILAPTLQVSSPSSIVRVAPFVLRVQPRPKFIHNLATRSPRQHLDLRASAHLKEL